MPGGKFTLNIQLEAIVFHIQHKTSVDLNHSNAVMQRVMKQTELRKLFDRDASTASSAYKMRAYGLYLV